MTSLSFGTVNPGPQKNKRAIIKTIFFKWGVEWDGEDERARVSLLSMPTGCFLTASNRPPCCAMLGVTLGHM